MPKCEKITVFGSPHERCGVAEYGRGLNEAFRTLDIRIEEKNIRDMSAFANAKKNVLVHFEPSLAPPTFYRLGMNLKRRDVRLITCCHYLDASVVGGVSNMSKFVAMHRRYEGFPMPVNGVIVPLACPVYDMEDRKPDREAIFSRITEKYPALKEEQEQPLIISTCGFVSAWKKFPELVDAIAPRLPEKAWLQLLCAPHFTRDEAEERRLAATAAKYPRVILEPNFISEKDFLDRLALSDVGFLYHERDTGSVSAATKAFVSTRVPIVVTDSSHASDIKGAVRTGRNVEQFAEEVIALARDLVKIRHLKTEMQREYERLNMIEVAGKYVDLFEAT